MRDLVIRTILVFFNGENELKYYLWKSEKNYVCFVPTEELAIEIQEKVVTKLTNF